MSDTATGSPQVNPEHLPRKVDETEALTIGREEATLTAGYRKLLITQGATALAPVIEIDRLYESAPGTSSHLILALDLLKQAIASMGEAQKSSDPLVADRHVQRAQLLLPRLFACRSIGDGFGVVINALHFAFANLGGRPLTPEQINVIWRVLRELRGHPALSLEQGNVAIEELEVRGLEVDPNDIGELLEEFESAEND